MNTVYEVRGIVQLGKIMEILNVYITSMQAFQLDFVSRKNKFMKSEIRTQ
jgi:hypothetical protein